jgi:isopentenyl-diphosphate Delta-isomerase
MPNPAPIMIPAIAEDGSLYPIEKLKAHQEATLHQAVSVFVFCGRDLLIQCRAGAKYHCGGTWANTCCTHPHWGETLDNSAHRRLREEMGFDVQLTPANMIDYAADVTNGLFEHERVQVYWAQINKTSIQIVLNTHEVDDYAWADIEHLTENAQTTPELYAPWFRIYLARWRELGLPI